VVLWEKIRSGSFEYQAKLSTYIYGTAKNIWLRRLAQRRREFPAANDDFETATEDPTPLEKLENNERSTAVQRAIGADRGIPARHPSSLLLGEQSRKKLP